MFSPCVCSFLVCLLGLFALPHRCCSLKSTKQKQHHPTTGRFAPTSHVSNAHGPKLLRPSAPRFSPWTSLRRSSIRLWHSAKVRHGRPFVHHHGLGDGLSFVHLGLKVAIHHSRVCVGCWFLSTDLPKHPFVQEFRQVLLPRFLTLDKQTCFFPLSRLA